MILLLGATGYIGKAFARELTQRKTDFVPLSRQQVDYTRFDALLEFLKAKKPAFVVNAAGYTGKPNVDACELHKADTLQGNTLFPQTVAQACAAAGIPWDTFRLVAFTAARKLLKTERHTLKRISRSQNCVRSLKNSASHPRFHRDGRPEFFFPR